MDITTRYLNLDLRSPFVVSASPLSAKLDNIKKMEEFGAAAVVLPSLFEEQLRAEADELEHFLTQGNESFAEAISYFPNFDNWNFGSERYLEHLRKAKEGVDIPIIASLNAAHAGSWVQFAGQLEEAGADALELNIYSVPTSPSETSESIESGVLEIVKTVRGAVSIPVAVKLSPYFSNLASLAQRLEATEVNGLVLFNRFYQPEIDLEELDVKSNLLLSTHYDLRLPLRWIAILKDQVGVDLAASSGVHQTDDALKVLLVGSRVAMLCSTLYNNGFGHIKTMETELKNWLERREYSSVQELQGSMSQQKLVDPSHYERALYMKNLHSFD